MSAMGDYALWLEETGRADSQASQDAYLASEARVCEQIHDDGEVRGIAHAHYVCQETERRAAAGDDQAQDALHEAYICQDPAHRTCGCPKGARR